MAKVVLEKPKRVRCCDCRHRHRIIENRNMLGPSEYDKFCPVPINGETLHGGMRHNQAYTAWRICDGYEPDGKEA